MNISRKEWKAYVDKLSRINNTVSDLVQQYIEKNGLDDVDALIRYSYKLAEKYGNASAAMNALMYDTIAEFEKIVLPPAELAPLPTYGDVAKAVNGTLKTSENPSEIGGAVSRLVKQTGEDTMLRNALRDGAQFAWIPEGETCAYCIMLASNGWQNMSRDALKNGHAEHIHSNCNCTYMVRHTSSYNVSGYDPDKYYEMYKDADGGNWRDKVNSMRREFYAENKDAINEQKRMTYRARAEALNSSTATETNVD